MSEPAGRRRALRRPWWRTLSSVRARLVMSLGVLVGFGAVGTSAFWTDTAIIEIAPIQSGTLDLQLGPNPDPQAEPGSFVLAGPGGTFTFTVVQLADVLPSESVALNLEIKNGGTAPLEFTGQAWSTNNNLFSGTDGLLVSTTLDGNATNTVDAAGYRMAGCGAGTTWWDEHPISTTPRPLTPGDPPGAISLQPDEVRTVCMLVELPASAPNALQRETTTLEATFDAVQVRP